MNCEISIIVPTYNLSNYIVDCLLSISNQSFQDWECIIVNDGSTDNSESIIKKYIKDDPRFVYIYQENQGVSAARNFGVLNSKGKFILPLDGDDIIVSSFLEKCYKLFENNLELKLVYTQGVLFDGIVSEWHLPDYSYRTLLKFNILPNTSMYLKDDFLRVGGYRANMNMGFEDWDFWITLLYNYPDSCVCRVDELLFKYRILNNSRSIQMTKDSNLSAMANRVLVNNIDIYIEKYGNLHEKIISYKNLKERNEKLLITIILRVMDLVHIVKSKFSKLC